jgi:hypothetical protein
MKQLSTGRTIAGQAVLVGTQRRGLNWRESLNTRDECLSSLRKARNAKGGAHLRRRLCRWESRALTLGRHARTVTRPGDLRAERFASAVSSFEGIAGAFSHQHECRRSQIRWVMGSSATTSASDSIGSPQHSSPIAIDERCLRQIHNKPGSKAKAIAARISPSETINHNQPTMRTTHVTLAFS